MGFTPLAGLVMATRSGDVDPGLVVWLEQHEGLSSTEVATALEHEAGLKALAGDPDMRHVLERERDAHREAPTAHRAMLRSGRTPGQRPAPATAHRAGRCDLVHAGRAQQARPVIPARHRGQRRETS